MKDKLDLSGVVPGVAQPRRNNVMAGTYTGAELQMHTPRQGAFDAMALPSRMGNRLVPRGAPAEPPVPYSPPPPAPAPAVSQAITPGVALGTRVAKRTLPSLAVPCGYQPRPGSGAWRIVQRLKEYREPVPYAALASAANIAPTTLTALMKMAIDKKAVVKIVVDGKACLLLPEFAPRPKPAGINEAPAAEPAPPPAPLPRAVADLVPIVRPVVESTAVPPPAPRTFVRPAVAAPSPDEVQAAAERLQRTAKALEAALLELTHTARRAAQAIATQAKALELTLRPAARPSTPRRASAN